MKIAKQWYAVYTKSRCEKKISELLTRKQIENFCPYNKIIRRSGLRKKLFLEPLFSSYIFVHVTEAEHAAIKETEGVLNFIYWLGKPAVINPAEISAIKTCLEEYQNIQLEQIDVDVNELVSINRGPFFGPEGKIMELNRSIKINLPSLGYAMIAEVGRAQVEIISKLQVFSTNRFQLFSLRRAV